MSLALSEVLKIGICQKPGFFLQYLRHFLVGCADLRGTQRFCWVALSQSPTYEWYFLILAKVLFLKNRVSWPIQLSKNG